MNSGNGNKEILRLAMENALLKKRLRELLAENQKLKDEMKKRGEATMKTPAKPFSTIGRGRRRYRVRS